MGPTSLSEFADKIGEIMPVIAKEFMKYQPGKIHKIKLTLPQFVILGFLNREGESRMTDMARFMRVTTAAMTGMVDRLVRDGYAVRAHDPKDRRTVKVKVTPKAARLVEEIDKQRRQATINIFSRISQAERETYLEILMHIRTHIK